MSDIVYMKKLYDLAFQVGLSVTAWEKAPPGFE